MVKFFVCTAAHIGNRIPFESFDNSLTQIWVCFKKVIEARLKLEDLELETSLAA